MHCDTQRCCPTSTSDAFACRELWRGHQQEHSSIFGTGTWTKPPPDFKTKGMKVTAGAQRNYKSGISSRLCRACQKADPICSKFHLSWYPGECGMTHRTAPSLNWKKVFPYSLKYTRCSLKRRKSDRKPAQWLRRLSSQRTSLVTAARGVQVTTGNRTRRRQLRGLLPVPPRGNSSATCPSAAGTGLPRLPPNRYLAGCLWVVTRGLSFVRLSVLLPTARPEFGVKDNWNYKVPTPLSTSTLTAAGLEDLQIQKELERAASPETRDLRCGEAQGRSG